MHLLTFIKLWGTIWMVVLETFKRLLELLEVWMVCHELHFFKCEMLVFTIVFDIGYWLKPFEVMKKMILLNQYVSL